MHNYSGLTDCVEHIDETTRYTYTGHTVTSFLEAHPEIYSCFIEILDRGDYLSHTTDENSLAVIIINGNGKIISRDESIPIEEKRK